MQEKNISQNNFELCLKCNICTTVCPMMAVNPHYPGPKQVGPDGERYRLKDPAFFDLTLKYCLNCKRCEVACPSGVKVGDIIQTARINYGKKNTVLRDRMLANTDFVGSLASPFAAIVNPVLKWKLSKEVLHASMGIDKHRTFPNYSSEKFVTWFSKEAAQKQEGFDRFISYFHGCYVNYNYPQLGKDMVRLLNACGYGVHLMDKERCCGVALISNGFALKAKLQGRSNVKAIAKALQKDEAVLTGSSTCTFTMRDEYEHILRLDTEEIRESVLLATKFIYDKIESGEIRLAFKKGWHKKVAYHSACHMEKLGWVIYSARLLKMIPGIDFTMLQSHCCGIAGTFGFKKENYPYSQQIGEPLFGMIREASPEVVATDCETCKWQIEMSTGFQVMNPVSILADAIDYEETIILNKHD